MKRLAMKAMLIFISFLTASVGFAQDRVIHGQVFTFDSIPLINANVKVKSTKQLVQTDTIGRFSVGCNNEDVITVSAEGFYKQKAKIEEKTKLVIINLELKPGDKNKEIAVGYGYVKDQEKLNAAVSLNNNEMDFSRYRNLYEIINGRFSGVQVMNNGDILIRGKNTVNGSNAALIVVDGMISDNSILSTLPPILVKSVNIIKDGSASIYGAQGANGVVLIETKGAGDN